jgi:hypothetical protein
MAENSSSSSSGGIGFVGLLTIVFITLKLLGKIDWPWVWVVSPIWIGLGIVLVILCIIAIIWAIVHGIKEVNYRRRRKAFKARQERAA